MELERKMLKTGELAYDIPTPPNPGGSGGSGATNERIIELQQANELTVYVLDGNQYYITEEAAYYLKIVDLTSFKVGKYYKISQELLEKLSHQFKINYVDVSKVSIKEFDDYSIKNDLLSIENQSFQKNNNDLLPKNERYFNNKSDDLPLNDFNYNKNIIIDDSIPSNIDLGSGSKKI